MQIFRQAKTAQKLLAWNEVLWHQFSIATFKDDQMKLSVEVSESLRERIKVQTTKTKRSALHECAKLIEEAINARELEESK